MRPGVLSAGRVKMKHQGPFTGCVAPSIIRDRGAGWSPTDKTRGERCHMADGQNDINYVVRGTGDPTLIFVHGFACALDDWEAQLRGLSPRFRCVALDLPGHGDSAKPEAISIEVMGTAVNRVKDLIAAPNTILVGHSMGYRVIVDAF